VVDQGVNAETEKYNSLCRSCHPKSSALEEGADAVATGPVPGFAIGECWALLAGMNPFERRVIAARVGALLLALFFLALGCGSFATANAADLPEAEAKAALQQWMTASTKAKSVTADFEQLRNLRNVKRPLRKQGKLWIVKEGGKFRWQIGEPPTVMVVRGADGGMMVVNVAEKEAQVWSKETLLEREKEGKGQGFSSMMEAMNSPSLAEFEQRFKLEDWRVDPSNPAWWEFDLSFRDRRTSLVVRQLKLAVNTQDGALRSMTLNMRDGSSLSTQIRSYTLNKAVPADVFKVDTAGYEVKKGE
jgi:outer membrane lipoprotein-sorting protein